MGQCLVMRTYVGACLLSLFLAAPCLAWSGRVHGVHDGDSIDVTNAEGALVTLRLYGIDAPEAKQSFGFQARQRLRKLVSRRSVEVSVLDTDRYGRNVALVRLADGTHVNEEMVRAGLAWVYDAYCQDEAVCALLRQAQAEARTAGRGLWAEISPQPPWEWRREHKSEEWYKAPVRVMKKLANKIKVIIH